MASYYDPTLVVLSFIIAALASYAALDLTSSLSLARGRAQLIWLAISALAMGSGIWSMHFTGMLAFHLHGRSISYDVTLLVASIVIAIVASMIALFLFTHPKLSRTHLVIAGLSMGVAIAGMHYTGMAGLRTAAVVSWDGPLVVLSILIAVGASFVALNLAARVRMEPRHPALLKFVGALIMGVAIAGMHYTAMAAAEFHPGPMTFEGKAGLLATDALALGVIISSIMILFVAIGGSVVTRMMSARGEQILREQRLVEQLRESEEYYRALIENASDLIVVVDEHGTHRYVSPSYERVLGYDPRELVGRSAWELVHPEDMAAVGDAFQKFAALPGTRTQMVLRVRHADGTWRTVNAIAQNFLHDAAINGIIVTAQDETERRRLEMQFQQSQKMEAVGKLAGGVAHDFNNLLTVILGNVAMLMNEHSSSTQDRETLTEVQDAALRAAALTRQLLAFSRMQVLQPRTLMMNDIVIGMHKMMVRLLSEDIAVQMHLDPSLPSFRADAGQVEQALLNLVVNARDAMPHGGVLTLLTMSVRTQQPIHSLHDVIPPGQYVALEVTDSGTGMEKPVLDRIFEPFFTTKETGRGTGLGLATVYGIMKQSGGYVSVRSKLERGSTFRLLFPALTEAVAEVGIPDAPVGEVNGNATILLIEDEPAVRSFAKRALEQRGYLVLDAASGEAAIDCANRHAGPIHLILSDVVLPDINGREASEQIISRRPGARVLYMSGYTEDEIIHRGVLSSGLNFIQKPFAPRELIAKVRMVLEN